MTEGRLFRSAAASGPLAEQAEIALRRPSSTAPEADSAGMPPTGTGYSQPDVAASVIPTVVPPVIEPAADFDHLFAAPDVAAAADPAPAHEDIPAAAAEQTGSDPLDAFDHLFTGDTTPSEANGVAPAAAQAPVPATSAVAADAAPSSSAPTPHDKPSLATGLAALRAMGASAAGLRSRLALPLRGVATLIIGSTLLTGTVEALLAKHIGIVTGIVSVLVTLGCSFRSDPADRSAAVFALPTAWLLCALLPGQLVAPSGGSWAFRQVVLVLQVLGDNAWWIIIGSGAAFAISLTARRNSSAAL